METINSEKSNYYIIIKECFRYKSADFIVGIYDDKVKAIIAKKKLR